MRFSKTVGSHRHVARRDWHRHRAAEPAQRAHFLQLASDEHPRRTSSSRPGLIEDAGEITNDETAEFLRSFMAAFHVFIARVRSVLPRDA